MNRAKKWMYLHLPNSFPFIQTTYCALYERSTTHQIHAHYYKHARQLLCCKSDSIMYWDSVCMWEHVCVCVCVCACACVSAHACAHTLQHTVIAVTITISLIIIIIIIRQYMHTYIFIQAHKKTLLNKSFFNNKSGEKYQMCGRGLKPFCCVSYTLEWMGYKKKANGKQLGSR